MSLFLLVAVSAEPFVGAGKIVSIDPNGVVEVEFARSAGKLPVDVTVALLLRDEKHDPQEIRPGSTLVVIGRAYGTPRKGKPRRLPSKLVVCFMPNAPMPRVEGSDVRIGVVKKRKPFLFEAGGKLYHVVTSALTPIIIRSRAKFPEFKVGMKLWVKGEKARLRSRKRGERRERVEGVKAKEALLLAPRVTELSYGPLLR